MKISDPDHVLAAAAVLTSDSGVELPLDVTDRIRDKLLSGAAAKSIFALALTNKAHWRRAWSEPISNDTAHHHRTQLASSSQVLFSAVRESACLYGNPIQTAADIGRHLERAGRGLRESSGAARRELLRNLHEQQSHWQLEAETSLARSEQSAIHDQRVRQERMGVLRRQRVKEYTALSVILALAVALPVGSWRVSGSLVGVMQGLPKNLFSRSAHENPKLWQGGFFLALLTHCPALLGLVWLPLKRWAR